MLGHYGCLNAKPIAVFCQKSSDFSIFENRQMSQSRASKNDLGTTRILRKKRRRRKIFYRAPPLGGRRERASFLLLAGNGTGAEKQNALTAQKRKYVCEALSLPLIGELRRRRVLIRLARKQGAMETAGGRRNLLPWERDTLHNIFLPSPPKYDIPDKLWEARRSCTQLSSRKDC